jgi:disulfide bond formation protein DsbB
MTLHPADPRLWIGAAAAACVGMLLAAFFFQHVMGLAPCPLCIWQRWPHLAGAVLGGLALWRGGWAAAALGALAMAVSLGLAGYHVGVEQDWWDSAACAAGGDVGALSAQELLAQIRAAPIVRCDEVTWSLLGVSMAGWNAVASLGLGVVFAAAAWRLRRGGDPAHIGTTLGE